MMPIIVIRISGQVDVPGPIKEALFRMKLRKKFSAVILNENIENKKLLKKVRDYVAYGKASEETLSKLKEARGQSGKKFFRLHPPRGGIESKKHFGVGKGVLGDNKEKIKELLLRML